MSRAKQIVQFIVAVAIAAAAYWYASIDTDLDLANLDGVRADAATGIEFPLKQSFQVGKKMTLLGVGTRKKLVLDVYSLGFYASSQVVKAAKGKKGTGTASCDTILAAKGAKAVQLTFLMGIGADKIAEAISAVSDVDQSTKDAFKDMLLDGMGGKMLKGESMTFEWKDNNSAIVATARGAYIGEMKDKNLAKGVLDLYLGPRTVSPSLVRDIERTE